ncbi:MAG TPA: MarR family transcriptional regulator [Candidatus Thermoplasmatota archaeon]
MDSLILALVDETVGRELGSRVDRLLDFPAASEVLIAVRTFVMSLLQPRNVAVAGGISATVAAILSYRWWKYGLFALFSRILPPKVLDQATRAKIFQFIETHPGIRAQQVVKDLGLATGQAMHHLYILEKQGLLTRSGAPLGKRYFVRGRLSPHEMQSAIVHQNAPLASLQTAIERRPGATITELASELQLSSGRVSRMAQQLAQAGTVKRVAQGRIVRLYANPV